MAEFLDYKVDLLLKDGSRSSGFISSVDSTQIVINNKSANVIYQANSIQDLKVIQLPKKKKKKAPQTNGNNNNYNNNNNNTSNNNINNNINSNNNSTININNNGVGLIDDAIVYHKLKPKSEDIKINDIDSDIQDFNHEFDFEANLAMFDKKSVFADFHKQDNVSSRLVDYNKLKPKTKYGNDEMIINSQDNWENIGKKDIPIPVEIPKENDLHLRSQYGSVISATPIQLLEIERLAENFGFNQDLLNEVCATNLSKLIIRNLGDSTRLSKRDNHNLPPLVLILIGSSRCGSRALATGRHLSNHGIRVLGFVINQDDNNLQQQIKLFENSGGKIIYNKTSTLFDVINNQLDSPVELILDGLQGYDDHLDDVFYNNKPELLSLINWLNQPSQSRIIMALDLPSGIDGGSGMITNEKYLIKCKWCISMGVPITGLLLAYKNRHLENHDIIHYLIDVGIPNKVYSAKSNLRKFDKFWYCAESYMIMELSK